MADATEVKEEERLSLAAQEELAKELELIDPAEVQHSTDAALEEKAAAVVALLTGKGTADPELQERTKAAVENYGFELQKEAALRSEKLRDPVKKMSTRSEEGGEVAKSLVDLKMQVEALDPARFDFEPGWFSRLLGYLPGVGTPMKRYFSRYESAQTILNAVIQSLESGREQLKRDNITLSSDQQRLREACTKLVRGIQLAQLIDAKLQHRLENELVQGGEEYRFTAEELLFPLRQRITDLQQQLAVSQQGILAMEVVIRNNKELIRGVNRALNVTINALQVAATVALALADQRIVLEKVQALTRTTSDLIAGTASRLKMEGAAVHKQAASTQLDMESLRKAFADIKDAMEDIARFRSEALPQMAQSIGELDTLIAETSQVIKEKEKAAKVEPIIPIEID